MFFAKQIMPKFASDRECKNYFGGAFRYLCRTENKCWSFCFVLGHFHRWRALSSLHTHNLISLTVRARNKSRAKDPRRETEKKKIASAASHRYGRASSQSAPAAAPVGPANAAPPRTTGRRRRRRRRRRRVAAT